MLYCYIRIDTTPNIKISSNSHEAWLRGLYQVIQNTICNILMKPALLSERPHIELQRFKLYTQFIRNILNQNSGEVRLPRLRTKTSKLRHVYPYCEITPWVGVNKCVYSLTGYCSHRNGIIRFSPKTTPYSAVLRSGRVGYNSPRVVLRPNYPRIFPNP